MDEYMNTTCNIIAQRHRHERAEQVQAYRRVTRISRKQPQSIRPPRDRGELPVQLSRVFDAHKVIIGQARRLARLASQLGDERVNDLVVSEALRLSELHTRFLSAHMMKRPLVTAGFPSSDASGRDATATISDPLKRLGEDETIPPSEQIDRLSSAS